MLPNYLYDEKFCKDNEFLQIFTDWVAKNKATSMLWASGYALGSDDPKIDKFLKDLAKNNNLENLVMKFEYILSKYGLSILFFDDNNQIRFANPIFPIYVQSNGEIPITMNFIETSRGWMTSDYYHRVLITSKGIEISKGFNLPNPVAAYMTKDIPKIEKLELNEYYESQNDIRGVYCQNFPEFNANIFSLNFRTPDSKNINKSFYADLKEAYDALAEDIYISQNKIIAPFALGIDAESQMAERKAKALKSMIFRNPDPRTINGKTVSTEFLKASPNAPILWQNIHNFWEYGLQLAGYSSTRGSSAYSTATENRFSKDLDLITTEQKRKLRQSQWIQLLDKILIHNNLWDGSGRRPYYFAISENHPSDKEGSLNRTKMLEDFGYISHSEAIQRQFPNLTKEEALEKMESIRKEREEFPEFNVVPDTSEEEANPSLKSQEQKLIEPDKKTQEKQQKSNETFQKKEN